MANQLTRSEGATEEKLINHQAPPFKWPSGRLLLSVVVALNWRRNSGLVLFGVDNLLSQGLGESDKLQVEDLTKSDSVSF